MTFDMLIFFASRQTRFWVGIVLLLILFLIAGAAYLTNKLTRGNTFNYIYYEMNEGLKLALILMHSVGSLILALVLPNNYLIEIDFIKRLYEDSDLWIPVSMLILLFSFILLFGTIFTLVAKLSGLKKIEERDNT